MSIPPLVCSTPPPPEQCEDDKDHEDFDYNLSQEEYDDESYDFSNFSTYNQFDISRKESQKSDNIISKDMESEAPHATSQDKTNSEDNILNSNGSRESNFKFEEDSNIEDLNLTLDNETIEDKDIVKIESEVETGSKQSNPDYIDREPDIPGTVDSDREDLQINDLPVTDLPVTDLPVTSLNEEPLNSVNIAVPPLFENGIEIVDEVTDIKNDLSENVVSDNFTSFDDANSSPEEVNKAVDTLPNKCEVLDNTEDDFGDFEDFQFTPGDNKISSVIDNCDNPWVSKELVDNSGFGDFKANFEDIESNIPQPESNVEVVSVVPCSEKQVDNQDEVPSQDDDDEYGDFEDFKSSSIKVEENEPAEQLLPVLNLQVSETLLLQNINKVINSIFEEELPQPTTEFEGKLDTLLGETWGHLLETDVRQPYIVNWNNSTGQKALLKSLCIDSRNILFGPKWYHNMPKYAANLSTAPLQPQKQSATANQDMEPQSLEKSSVKTSCTWSDPFTQGGQESCNTENVGAVMETGPTDLDVFEATGPPKIDKIYSSTLSVQPICQINLPDTHIFTPTDSETPRSKKIHYDSSPTILLPQTMIESKSRPLDSIPQSNVNVQSPTDTREEDWEFQDFKGASDYPTPTQNSSTNAELTPAPSTSVRYETQVLQPIRVEPVIPTLNWPDPGEVKETFDDFSDFVSNTQWTNDKPNISVASTSLEKSDPVTDASKESAIVNEERNNDNSKSTDNLDDNFDTFQSAIPSVNNVEIDFSNFNKDSSSVSLPPQLNSQNIPKFDNVIPGTSFADSPHFSNAFPSLGQVQNEFSNFTDINITPNTTKSLPTQPHSVNMLQLTPATTSTINNPHQKSAQILQPLSLESYSQINWPNPGIDLQDLSRFNPVETLQSLKTDLSVNGQSKGSSPIHSQKNSGTNQPAAEDDIWGEFVSSKPNPPQTLPKKPTTYVDDDEWTDFVSSPSVKPQNGLNTISLNVHTNLTIQKTNQGKFGNNQLPLDIPSLNYITPKNSTHKSYNDRHFQNL